jgi:hypothetical protein
MVINPLWKGSNPVMSLSIRIVSSPPYCGFPSFSHQFPAVVVTGLVEVVAVVIAELVVEVAVVAMTVVEVVTGAVVEVVEVVHDASIRDSIIRPVNANQVTPFFIQTPSLFKNRGEFNIFPRSGICSSKYFYGAGGYPGIKIHTRIFAAISISNIELMTRITSGLTLVNIC